MANNGCTVLGCETNHLTKRDALDCAALAGATIRKLRAERKIMHEMLTEAGIPGAVADDGIRTCLIGRLAVLIARGNQQSG